jgi:DNA gyrase/topoisomerase IV subunit B
MSMSEKFKILTPREHIRARIGMYLGSPVKEEVERFILGKWRSSTFVPAISKMIDEILDNSIDEAIRTKFKHANKIDVTIKDNSISITDNGRGIPQESVHDAVTGMDVPRPVAAWTKTNAGTSFDDNRVTIGTNGVGSAATNFLSTTFVGETWSGNQLLTVACANGAETVDVSTKRKTGSGTRVTFTPDFSFFDIDNLEDVDTIDLVKDRLSSLQIAFPEITFSFNGYRIDAQNIQQYAGMYAENKNDTVILEKSDDLSFFVTGSSDGFRTTSFVNGVNTRQGGVYVNYIIDGIVDELEVLIKRKHKVSVPKSTIKNGFQFVMFARNFADPRFDSQTKLRLTNPVSHVKKHFEAAGVKDFKTIAKKIVAAADLIDPITTAAINKQEAEERRNAARNQKNLKRIKVAKHVAAAQYDATLVLTEGDSALGNGLKVRDPQKVGLFPLRGVIKNVFEVTPSEALKNKEIGELVAILGLDINDPKSVDNRTYKYVAALTDSDHDGQGHIMPLVISFFYKFWPKLFEDKCFRVIRSPIMISSNGKDTKWFYSYDEAQAFKDGSKGYSHRYIKGLGSLTEEEYSLVLNDPSYDCITVSDPSYLQLMFDKKLPDERKEFILK